MTRPCSIDGCSGTRKAKGLCASHYARLLRGRAVGGQIAPAGKAAKWIVEAALHHRSDECLIWPFSRFPSGYAKCKSGNAHRLICTLAHGAPAQGGMVAAHSCGNGHLGCVNPRHLRWASVKENLMDRLGHGTDTRGRKNWNTKLTERAVQEIRDQIGTASLADLGRQYGVSRATIRDVITRKTWAWLP